MPESLPSVTVVTVIADDPSPVFTLDLDFYDPASYESETRETR